MELRSFFASLSLVLLSYNAISAEKQNIEALRNHVLAHTTSHYRNVFGEENFKNNVKIRIGNLDSRLRLNRCDDNLTFKISQPPQNISNITVKTSCVGKHRWTIYVPVKIDVYANVLVAKRSLSRGHLFTEHDLDYRQLNTASSGYGYLEDMSRVIGMELKRPISSGDIVHLALLKKPNIVRKGQTVIVTSKSRFLSVETEGIALISGQLGQDIRVKNQRSNKIVQARIVAPGIVATR
ncbi:flagellar basal body P-ring formation chaperone FlgA [Agarilytica rhodophyticola]|uniref:flagellar basal body P-ring formation chaperone FlgA n=1 Tax=Agarilytica rhodophyticola TaxID=1737490 RepID=UPI000B3412A7|nr:flagellar basal body P-ring formation chaperone FlgA [Agarilytica rhodophyticola]